MSDKGGLSPEEQAGVDYFVMFLRKVRERQAKEAVAEVEAIPADVKSFKRAATLIGGEDIRFLPVIVTSYCDDLLGQMFRRELPGSVPGGLNQLVRSGALARLANRIQIAYAFNWINRDVLAELDQLRGIRNEVSHRWDIQEIRPKIEALVQNRMIAAEVHLDDASGGHPLPKGFSERLSLDSRFRIRLQWLCGQMFFQARYWPALVKRGLNPDFMMYGGDKEGEQKLIVDDRVNAVLGVVGRSTIDLAERLIQSEAN